MKHWKESFGTMLYSRAVKNGAYASAISALVVALVVAVNLIISALPSRYTSFDLTDEKIFSLSEESKQLAETLTQEIDIYYLAVTGQEDAAVSALLEKYAGLSSHITVTQKDPVIYPAFGSGYGAASAASGSVIVDGNNGRYRVIDSTELYEQTVNYETYSYDTSFAGESKITSALSYVASEDLPVLYLLTGHGEAELATSYANSLADANITTQSLNLLTVDAVPEDADSVLLNAATKDLSAEEAQKLSEYLAGGGSLILVTNYGEYTAEEMPNLAGLMAEYGLSAQEGIVIENDQNYYLSGYPYYLLPEVNSHDITEPLLESYLLTPLAHGIEIAAELPENVQAAGLLTTTSAAYLKENAYSADAITQADDDLTGAFHVAVAAENTETGAHLVWMSTSGFFDEGTNEMVSGANLDFVLNAINWGSDNETGITLHAKSMAGGTLTVTQGAGNLWSTLLTIVIPVAMLVIGVVIWAKRRKR